MSKEEGGGWSRGRKGEKRGQRWGAERRGRWAHTHAHRSEATCNMGRRGDIFERVVSVGSITRWLVASMRREMSKGKRVRAAGVSEDVFMP